jgi:hypothetical protein
VAWIPASVVRWSTLSEPGLRSSAQRVLQSSMAQVREHTESTMRQYSLINEVVRLGWARADVL